MEAVEEVVSSNFGQLASLFSDINDEIQNLHEVENEYKEKLKMENIGDKILTNADKAGNNDGKTTAIELFSYVLKNPVFIFLAVVVISFMPIKEFLQIGISENIWDWVSLLDVIGNGVIGLIFFLFSKASDGEYKGLIDNIKELFTNKESTLNAKIEKLTEENSQLKDENVAYKAKISLMDYQLKQYEK
jgi:uncharacterized protein YdcH (DUF465 family)